MELELDPTIEYINEWYYKNYPGFYNIDFYKILADYSHNPKKYKTNKGVEEENEEYKVVSDEILSKKLRLDNNNSNGL